MSNLDFTISYIVIFFDKKLRNPPNLNNGKYSPHILIKGTDEHLEIDFIDGEDVIFDKPICVNVLPENENIDYSNLQSGTEFLIVEGSIIV